MPHPKPQLRGHGPARPIPLKPVKPAPPLHPVPQAAGPARRRPRHLGLIAGFLALVLLPAALSGGYLAFRAVDQYDSTAGFAVQSEKSSTMIDLLGGISQLSGASDTQAAMVYQFLQSRDLVERLDKRLNLRARFAGPYRTDPVFAFDPSGTMEDLVDYWSRMVSVSYDSGTGLITLDVHAFSAADAQAIAQAAFEEASRMINDLSDIAQTDTMRAAREELWQAEDRVRKARGALQKFREDSQVIDPTADFTGQMGVINALQSQLAAAMVELDLLRQTTGPGDARIAEARRKIEVIRARIADERQSFGTREGATDTVTLARLTGDYERLSMEQDFAEKAYVTALGALDSAEAAARQQSMYLAAYQRPVTAQASEYPRRWLLTGLVAMFGFLIWSVLALVYYSLRDRR